MSVSGFGQGRVRGATPFASTPTTSFPNTYGFYNDLTTPPRTPSSNIGTPRTPGLHAKVTQKKHS